MFTSRAVTIGCIALLIGFKLKTETFFTTKEGAGVISAQIAISHTSAVELSPDNILESRNWRQLTECKSINEQYYERQTHQKVRKNLMHAWFDNCTTVGGLLWIRMVDIGIWANEIMPHMKKAFTLITSDGDYSIPSNFLPQANRILESPFCEGWYTQNYDGSLSLLKHHQKNTKLYLIPIGLDLHTEWDGEPSEMSKKIQIMKTFREIGVGNNTELRNPAPFVPYMSFYERAPDREISHSALNDCGVTHVESKNRTSLDVLRQNYTQYRFVMSPRGNGLDTHRLWEVLYYGGIPIVKTSSLDRLYDGLPVLVVPEFRDLCQDGFLEEAYSRLRPLLPVVEEVFTMRYWIDRKVQI